MPQLVKPYTYSSGTTISSTQVNANEDAIINTINALDEDNFDASTQIPNSMLAEIQPDIVDAHADSATEYLTATTPGTTAALLAGTTAVPALLTDELERLRYRLLANNHLISTYFMDSGGLVKDAGWVESAPFGPQLFANNGFEVKTSATASVAPDNWTLVGTPTSLVVTAPGLASPTAGKYKKAIRITCSGAAGEGLQQTLTGVKASTKYLIGMTFAKVSGTPVLKIETTNGLASGAYQNLAVTPIATIATISHVQAIVQTTTTGTDLTVKFTNTAAAADVFDIYQVWAYEVKDSTNLGLPHIPMQTASSSTESDVLDAGSGTWTTISALTLSQYIPARGYRLIYECNLTYAAKVEATMPETCDSGARIQMDIAGGGYNTVQGPFTRRFVFDTSGNTIRHSAHHDYMKHVVENPTPGSIYTFHAELGVFDGGANAADLVVNPDFSASGMGQSVSFARLYLERL